MDDFLTPYEVEHLVQAIVEIPLERYGSPEWFRQHETLDRLNIQAHKNAMNSTDEYVMDSIVTFDKVRTSLFLEKHNKWLIAKTWIAKLNDFVTCVDESIDI